MWSLCGRCGDETIARIRSGLSQDTDEMVAAISSDIAVTAQVLGFPQGLSGPSPTSPPAPTPTIPPRPAGQLLTFARLRHAGRPADTTGPYLDAARLLRWNQAATA